MTSPRKGAASIRADAQAQMEALPRPENDEPPYHDPEAIKTWIYPSKCLLLSYILIRTANYSRRDYQFNIVKSALFENTMVCLPTGLGKTFIAAVVMHNFYRWFPLGKVSASYFPYLRS